MSNVHKSEFQRLFEQALIHKALSQTPNFVATHEVEGNEAKAALLALESWSRPVCLTTFHGMGKSYGRN